MFLYSPASNPWDCLRCLTLHPLADLFYQCHLMSLGSIQPRCNYCVRTIRLHPPLSVARCSFIQLGELRQRGVTKLPKLRNSNKRSRTRVLSIDSLMSSSSTGYESYLTPRQTNSVLTTTPLHVTPSSPHFSSLYHINNLSHINGKNFLQTCLFHMRRALSFR